MTTEIRGSNFPGLLDGLKYLPENDNYGCIMLDLKPIGVPDYTVDPSTELYYSPSRKYMQGAVSSDTPHVTLLYGLLQLGSEIRKNVDIALSGWEIPETLEVDHIGYFPPSVPGEDYAVVVAHIKVTDQLQEGHDRLRMLPHLDYFPKYRPHFTLAYTTPESRDRWISDYEQILGGTLTVLPDLNYGD